MKKLIETWKQIDLNSDFFGFYQSLAKRIKKERLRLRLAPSKMAHQLRIEPGSYQKIEDLTDLELGPWKQLWVGIKYWNDLQKISAALRAIDKRVTTPVRKIKRPRRH